MQVIKSTTNLGHDIIATNYIHGFTTNVGHDLVTNCLGPGIIVTN